MSEIIFKKRMPETYQDVKRWVLDVVISDCSEAMVYMNQYIKYLEQGKKIFDDEDLHFYLWSKEVLDNTIFHEWGLDTLMCEYEHNSDFRRVLKSYSKKYKDIDFNDYIDTDGYFKYYTFKDDTEMYEDIIKPLFKELINDRDVVRKMNRVNKVWLQEIKKIEAGKKYEGEAVYEWKENL